jgi:hypothetical protein
VRRDPDVGADVEERLERVQKIEPDDLVLLVGDLGRLDVDALADAHVRAEVRQRADVGQCALQGRLKDDAEVVVPSFPDLAIESKRLGRGRGVLHVDADEVGEPRRLLDDRSEVRAAETPEPSA